MKRLEKVLANAMPLRAIAHAAEAWRVLNRWDEIVGDPLAQKSWPDRFEKGTVWVATAGSAWSQELRMQKDLILYRIRGLLGKDLVRDVRFGVRALPPRPEAKEVRRPKVRPRSEEDIHTITDRILNRTKDDA